MWVEVIGREEITEFLAAAPAMSRRLSSGCGLVRGMSPDQVYGRLCSAATVMR